MRYILILFILTISCTADTPSDALSAVRPATTATRSPSNDTCHDAQRLQIGESVQGNLAAATNDYGLGIPGLSCSAEPLIGPDVVYEIKSEIATGISVRLNADFDGVIWLSDSCGDGFEHNCKSVVSTGAFSERLDFGAVPNTSYFIVVDALDDAVGEFEISVETYEIDCEPNTAISCESENVLATCDRFGFISAVECPNGCSKDACNTIRSGDCVQPVKLDRNDSYFGRFDTVNDLTPGTCDEPQVGSDTVFEIALNAGDRLSATLDSESAAASVYLQNTCGSSDCVGSPGFGQALQIQYHAMVDETIYVVVDRVIAEPSDQSFTLVVTTHVDGCDQDWAVCDGERVTFCDGVNVVYRNCTGGCSDARCIDGDGASPYAPIQIAANSNTVVEFTDYNRVTLTDRETTNCDFGATQLRSMAAMYLFVEPGTIFMDGPADMETYLLDDVSLSTCEKQISGAFTESTAGGLVLVVSTIGTSIQIRQAY